MINISREIPVSHKTWSTVAWSDVVSPEDDLRLIKCQGKYAHVQPEGQGRRDGWLRKAYLQEQGVPGDRISELLPDPSKRITSVWKKQAYDALEKQKGKLRGMLMDAIALDIRQVQDRMKLRGGGRPATLEQKLLRKCCNMNAHFVEYEFALESGWYNDAFVTRLKAAEVNFRRSLNIRLITLFAMFGSGLVFSNEFDANNEKMRLEWAKNLSLSYTNEEVTAALGLEAHRSEINIPPRKKKDTDLLAFPSLVEQFNRAGRDFLSEVACFRQWCVDSDDEFFTDH
jgi:hypothetical protein